MQHVQGAPVFNPASTSAPESEHIYDPSGKYLVKHQGSFAVVQVRISPNDTFKAEGGAMLSMPKGVKLDAKMEGSCPGACCRCCCAESNCCYSHYSIDQEISSSLPGGNADVLVSPKMPGDCLVLELKGEGWVLQKNAFVCCDQDVHIGVHCTSCSQGCCGGEGFFLLKATGSGRLVASTYGSIVRYDLKEGETRVVDNGNLVAWSDKMKWEVKLATGCMDSFLSGEGFITKFSGPGVVYCQTRTLKGLAESLLPYFEAIGKGRA
mmetsp:Transcript_26486/g.36580  ORF Transcript_26486/g.36580 Transcript_26486/m.36580 type:complete len:265 (+) Transcript_26486:142-936(+)|eukprot:CAMPEP_0196572708 /NCGR_PEP_ID=MMETSP1081-20130531/2705_1 /TAXON_ID=36882 /ORGANISM="Pyramimonas amylifera, Strain CCMP720" /LENGTH=264 /DNA_ID=CAMNT_0041890113 /DNA_START=141 /DNA_END=935 /DNA_ORIENTATION=-